VPEAGQHGEGGTYPTPGGLSTRARPRDETWPHPPEAGSGAGTDGRYEGGLAGSRSPGGIALTTRRRRLALARRAVLGALAGLALGAPGAGAEASGAEPSFEGAPGAAESRAAAAAEPAAPALATAAEAALTGFEARPRFAREWSRADRPLAERVEATRTAALELGLRNVEPAARALLASPPEDVGELEAARAAARLAPDLPAAQMRLAQALAADGQGMGALQASLAAGRALYDNLEASLWLYASASWTAASTLVWGSLGFLLLAGVATGRTAAHDLGDRISERMPGFSRVALLCALGLAPAVAGEGALGVALGALAVVVYGGGRGLAAVALLAALGLGLGLHPLARETGRALGAYDADPVALAAHAAQHGVASPMDLSRLARAADRDPLAARALAMGIKRQGHLEEADARYRTLLATDAEDPVLLNNAANVRLALGDTEGAIELYRRAAERLDSAVIWFNLSQAWGVALQVVELDAALARAQALDAGLIEDFSEVQERAVHFVADLPVPAAHVRERVLERSDGGAIAGELRRALAPGWAGSRPAATAVALAGALALGLGLRVLARASGRCERCGALVCPRCHPAGAGRALCESCHTLIHPPKGTDRALRAARAEELRRREEQMRRLGLVAALAIPGAAGLWAGRPLLAWAGCTAAAALVAFARAAGGWAPDPLAVGAAGPVAFGALAALAGLLYLSVLGAGLSAARDA